MPNKQHRNTRASNASGFMARLGKDVRGNTMAIMGAALIPLAGMVGGGVDIARMYIVKTRLQHACDAGALAGRKAMGGGTWAQTVNGVQNYPNIAAGKFFDANYQSDAYGASGLTRTFTENAGKVSGTASATLPMTLMKIFGRSTETLSVTCDAEMRLPNTDVMFVLDTTGSMAETPSGDSQTKMVSLKSAVKCFYEIVARLDTDEVCTTGTPSGGTGDQVQIRFGFVPYATNVNVGRLLPTSYFANSWAYQSREAEWTTTTGGTSTNGPYWEVYNSGNGIPQSDCLKYMNNQSFGSFSPTATASGGPAPTATVATSFPSDGVATQGGSSGEWGYSGASDDSGTNRSCRRRRTDVTTTYPTTTFNRWHYGRITHDISGLKNGTLWNTSFTLPIASNGTSKTITWDGCIEERTTTKAASYDPVPAAAKDLDIDLAPSQSDATTLWAPALDDVIYTRSDPGGWWGGSGYWTLTDQYTSTDYVNGSQYYCPTPAKKLQQWPAADDFDTYVDSLTPNGNTYHDIGLLWGARLASPTGIFSSENAYTPQGGEIERHIIFMTDGDPCTGIGNYQAYGIGWFDRRQTDASTAPTDGCTTTGTLTAQVNARTAAICTAIKNKNITLWVITFGTLSADTVTRMTACATPGRYFNATNEATIQATFKSIADQISQLRLTK
ncbi:MAG TPA: TadE/TadG family type IV pilus assembly protein [Sphingomonas sp.]|nr:TadE/TadG family type IV pilus assembly protein [Sphingomonas sp.]